MAAFHVNGKHKGCEVTFSILCSSVGPRAGLLWTKPHSRTTEMNRLRVFTKRQRGGVSSLSLNRQHTWSAGEGTPFRILAPY